MQGTVREPIAAKNVLFGVSHFFVLPVSPPWELVRGPFEPEVDRWLRRGDASWVTDGRAAYLLFDRGTRRGIELHITVKRHPASALRPPSGNSPLAIGSHRAHSELGEVHRGLWPRRRLHRLELNFVCEPLSRKIGLELIGAYGPDPLLDLARRFEDVECH